MSPGIDITTEQRKTLLALLRRFIPGVAVWAYGSRVKWTARPNSDLDLVAFTTPEQSALVSELKDALAESDIPFLVDFHVWDEVPERFHEIIRKEFVVLQEAEEKRMGSVMAGDGTVRLGNVCSKIGSGATPRGGKEAYKGGATALIRSQNIYNDGFHRDGLVFIDDNQSLELRNVEVQPNDVLLNITGDSVARCCQVVADVLPARVNQHVAIIRPKPSALDARFLRYVLVSHDYQSRLLALASAGATRPALTKTMIEGLDIPAPQLHEQKAIAHILGTLDDKIELNRRMNATLEAMARALFQSWFVDFDPVRAKLDGRQPAGLDEATSALFPTHFQDSPLGHIPQGWRAGTLSEDFNLTMGQSPPGDTYNEDGNGMPFYQGRTDFGFRFPTHRIYCTAPTRYAKPGDTLVSVRAPVGDINMADEECCIGRGVAAVRHKSGAVSFTYHAMENLSPDFALFEGEGTVFGSINKQNFEDLRFVMPPPEIVAAYEQLAKPLDDQIRTLEHQSRTLATLRDALLPKLLSGKLRVKGGLEMTEEN